MGEFYNEFCSNYGAFCGKHPAKEMPNWVSHWDKYPLDQPFCIGGKWKNWHEMSMEEKMAKVNSKISMTGPDEKLCSYWPHVKKWLEHIIAEERLDYLLH